MSQKQCLFLRKTIPAVTVALLLTPRGLCCDALRSLAEISRSIPTYYRHAGTTCPAVTRLTGQGCVCAGQAEVVEALLSASGLSSGPWSMRGTTTQMCL